eukprot:g22486.t1
MIEDFIIKKNFCPWAAQSMASERLRFVDSTAESTWEAKEELEKEVEHLSRSKLPLSSSVVVFGSVDAERQQGRTHRLSAQEAWKDFDVFDAYVKALDRGRWPCGTRHGRRLPPVGGAGEVAHVERSAPGFDRCRLVAFHPDFARWLLPKRGNGSLVHIDFLQKRVFSDPYFSGEPAVILDPAPEEIEVGPRQLCAQLLGGSGPCAWDLDCVLPEEDQTSSCSRTTRCTRRPVRPST